MTIDPPRWDVELLAEAIGCHPETIRLHIRQGKLKAFKNGKRWRMYDEDVDAYIRSNPSPETSTVAPVSLIPSPSPPPPPERTASGRLIRARRIR